MNRASNEQKLRKKVLKKNSSTFYLAGLLLPKKKLDKAATLYSFCRWVDDLADEAKDSYRAHYFLGKINSALHGDLYVDPLVSETRTLIKSGFGGITPTIQLVNTVRSDLSEVRIDTVEKLIKYCYGVAGTVGIMMSSILETKNVSKAWKHAVDLGIAMQLTNICRDVYADAKLDRRYLPAEIIGDITPAEILLLTKYNDKAIRTGIKQILHIAEKYYESGLNGLRYLPFGCRLAICAAAINYREIGRLLLKRKCISWRTRSFVSTARKISLLITIVIKVTLKSLGKTAEHDKTLHSPIISECQSLR